MRQIIILVVSVIAFIASVVWYLFGNSNRFKGVSWKYACSSLFVIIALVASCFSDRTDCFTTYMLLGFIMSAFGDMFLDLSMDGKAFTFGVLSFALGHCFYIAGYSTVLTADYGVKFFSLLQLLLLGGYILLSLALYIFKKYKPDFKHILVYVYGVILMTMFIKAQFVGFYGGGKIIVTATLGALLFFVSDLILLGIIFDGKNDRTHTRWNLATYFGGQMLMALGLAVI